MDKSTHLLLAVVLAVFGISVTAGHPAWGTFTGLAIIVLAAGLVAGALPIRSRDFLDERAAPSQRVSAGVVALSSAAVVAIYAAGYQRTNAAARRFELQSVRATGDGSSVPPNPAPPVSTPNPAADATPPKNAKTNAGNTSSVAVRKKPRIKPDSGGSQADRGSSPVDSSSIADSRTTNEKAAAASVYKDGMYSGRGSCPHGDIEVSVVIQDGKIASTTISQCLTRYSCSWIAPTVPSPVLPDLRRQVVERQSAKVDYVSGATESSYAFADAVAAALAKARE